MAELTKGGNAAVGADTPHVAVRWRANDARIGEIDVSAFLLRADGKVSGDDGMVFYGQRGSAGGGVTLERIASASGASKETAFSVGFTRLPPDIERIAFTGTIHDGPATGLSFGQVEAIEIAVLENGSETVRFQAPVAGSTETALILGELYRRNGVWKFRAVAQGFAGGLAPLARSFGVDIAADAPAPPPAPVPPPAAPVSLSKVTLSKAKPSVDLQKKAGGFGEVTINLNWSRQKRGGLFSSQKPVDLDIGCLFELADGSKSAVQALGNMFGAFDTTPFIQLAGDDRSGASADGEWMRINGRRWSDIRRVLIYAFIYEGVPNWAATDGVVTVYVPDAAPIEVRLEDGGQLGMCAIVLIENAGGEMRISRQVAYFKGHAEMDKQFGFGLRWGAGSK